MSGPAIWSEAEARLLNALLDEIVPASADGRVPAAGALGVAEHLASSAEDDPALAALFREGLAHAARLAEERGAAFEALDAAKRIGVLEALEREAPEVFTALLRHTYMGYYSRADVRPHFGLSDRPTQPEGYELPEDDPDELADMLAPVRARSRCYRPT
ncbi:MAG: gluconate 2-dehydrogenase subunit 3 family protein [Rhodospirillales bacterium]|nr:gluconate 2-dehydrogenase subunit 3 family protein [Rhodospirillales bacterium]